MLYVDEFFINNFNYKNMEDKKQIKEENTKSQIAIREEAVLNFWKENKIFEKSLEKNSGKKEYVFYEGPPTANGKPGIHHLEARAFKDAIPRYKTMRGYHVSRKGGWDTHGLPVELQVEKKLGLNSKKAIEEYGIEKFNKECKESVWEYTDLWEKFTDRIGYWVDQKNAYVTYYNDYIESVWNVLKTVNEKRLLFKDYKVVPWCPRCGTALSSHEIAQGYMDVKDLSLYVKFRIVSSSDDFLQVLGEDRPLYILAWTTTPWTLPGNVALAVGKDINYVKIKVGEEFYILAKARLSILENEYEIVDEFKGEKLIGLQYEQLYPYLSREISEIEKPKLEKAFTVYAGNFVTTEDGTGVVHIAPMYGVDDFNLGNENTLPKHHVVGLDGKFLPGTDFLEGRFVKDEEVAIDIIKDLAHRNLLLKKEKYEHSYPHCWRCKTPLIYYARDSWYIRMSSLRDELIKENKEINWEPDNIKEGRFGEWLKDIKDWAISRERYWGSPLPVWICNKCNKREVIGSIKDLREKIKDSGNNYFLMRHGESQNNLKDLICSNYSETDHLTDQGVEQVKKTAEILKNKKIDLIFSSPLLRTKETAQIVANILNYPKEKIIEDDRLKEMQLPSYNGKTWDYYHKNRPNTVGLFDRIDGSNENWMDIKKRVMNFLYEIDSKYQNKNILVVTHGGPVWLGIAGVNGFDKNKSLEMLHGNSLYVKNAEFREINKIQFPHNENYELDLHKPYIDKVELVCNCGGELERVKEVMDVWLDSGCMPFAQDHYPFENKEKVDHGGYPADFISEAMDQTRGWFYTLHAIGVLMGKGKAFKNVICLGLILDANGKKMSKSIGNIVDPWYVIDKYGVDTLRMWMYGINQPGESKNFDEKTVNEFHNKIFNLLYNVIAFYELYRDKNIEKLEYKSSSNILDRWIVSRLMELLELTTKNLDNYKLLEPTRAIRLFIDDFSTWYLRRSRERLKDGNLEAKQTMYFVIKTLTKIMAPLAPFASEDIWQKLRTDNDEESIHLVSWPKIKKDFFVLRILGFRNKRDLISEMEEVREIVTLGLQARQKARIPVRQPLSKLILTNHNLSSDYVEIVKDELNVKEIEMIKGEERRVELDLNITSELKQEGNYRELVRAIQDMRKKNSLNPNDVVDLIIYTSNSGQDLINYYSNDLIKSVGAKDIVFKENNGVEFKIDEFVFKIEIIK